MLAETGKVRIEMNQRIQKMETERQTQAELYDKINKLEKELAGETAGPMYWVPLWGSPARATFSHALDSFVSFLINAYVYLVG